jgi:hypothetical protein
VRPVSCCHRASVMSGKMPYTVGPP